VCAVIEWVKINRIRAPEILERRKIWTALKSTPLPTPEKASARLKPASPIPLQNCVPPDVSTWYLRAKLSCRWPRTR